MPLDKQQVTYIVVAVIVVALIAGGGYYATHGGSLLANQVVLRNERCQELFKKQSKEYDDCQNGLDRLVSGLVKTKEMDVTKCKNNPKDQSSVLCPVKIGCFNKDIVVKIPDVVNQFSNKNNQANNPSNQSKSQSNPINPNNNHKYPDRRRRSLDHTVMERRG